MSLLTSTIKLLHNVDAESCRWRSSRGCHSVSFIVIIVILIVSILIIAVLAILVSELHDELILRLDYSFQLGLLLPQLLA
jgi:hypothetical protein